VEVPAWVASLSDRGVQSALVLVAVAALGFVGLGLTWTGAAGTLEVWKQTAFVVSGGFGGLALAGACLCLAAVHGERRLSATDRVWLESAIETAVDVSETLPAALRAARSVPPQKAGLVSNGRTVHRIGCRMASGKDLSPVGPGEAEGLRSCRICQP
jgi:hypothetical protein